MNSIIKNKWIVISLWIALVIGLFIAAPNMAELVREKGEIEVPEQYSSSHATEIIEKAQKQEGGGEQTDVALVFHNDNKLTEQEITEAEQAIRELEANKEELGITTIITHFNEPSLKEQLVSEDGKSILTSITLNWNNREADEVNNALYETIATVEVDHYYTSNWMISQDLINSSQEGLKKTEGITVVFILAVLLLVFRSAVAPFVPLLTVGISYLASQSIVAILVDTLNFPLSTYTQIFLVAVLFGIGTDYCILLLSRFKEELAQADSTHTAIMATYRNAGKTVFFSGIAVMIGFAAIGFSQFKLYQSAAAVAVGVAILLIALFTVVPFFMATLGQKLFWPSKNATEHKDSKLWGVVGSFALKRPLRALLIVVLICVPFLATYDGDLSFNSLDEISDNVPSIRAFNAISDSFGPGESMPTQIVLKNDEGMDSSEYIALIEGISQELEKVDLVAGVRSVTRPTAEQIDDLLVANQAEQLNDGLGEGKTGIAEISSGLQEASLQLAKSEPELKQTEKGISRLTTGTNDIHSGLTEIQANLKKIEDGIRQGSMGSSEIKNGLEQTKVGLEQLAQHYTQILQGYEAIEANLGTIGTKYQEVSKALVSLSNGVTKIKAEQFANLEETYDGLAMDASYQQMKGTIITVQQQLAQLSKGLKDINSGLFEISSGLDSANYGFEKAINAQQPIITGLERLIQGIDQQLNGLDQLTNGQGQIVSNIPKLTNGLEGISTGQQKLLAGFGDLGGQLQQLTDGLTQSADGLNQVSDGIGSAQTYLSGLANSKDLSSFYLPEEVLASDEFAQALDAYMTEDRKIVTLDVIFEANPYSNEAIDQVAEIESAVKRATKNTKLENATIAIGGVTSMNADLNEMSSADFTRTVILMLLGISIILVFLFRSIIMPIYIIGSLIITYYTSMAINEVIFVNLLGYSGISWAVPFFGFVILVALGVDYSIFLMDRFNEYKDLSISEAMLMAMKKMGSVIISAAVILGGTFAAMMPSGMLSLLQIAAIVLVGLFLYAFIILPLFIPVMVKNFGSANWWPFKRA